MEMGMPLGMRSRRLACESLRHCSVLLHPPADADCREVHREQLSIEDSLQNLDSAVARLDNLFESLCVFIAVIIVAVSLVVNYPISQTCAN